MVNPTSEQQLFWPPASHRNDPETSQEAEDSINASGSRASHCDHIFEVVKEHPGLTAGAIGVLTEDMIELVGAAVWKRLSDLKNRGRVRQGQTRVFEGSGRRQVTWWPVEVID
jgi:hypothetical protein